jgi:pimeloyl-ACP methyl ester carboxylesterase
MNLSTELAKFTISSGLTYGYIYLHPSPGKATILFLHGFPSAAYDWRHQVPHFSQAGYGVLAPDLLGYGSTDKPGQPEQYKGKKMASEIIEILDHEKIDKVHGVGHDWGSYMLSRLANYHSHRFLSYSFLDVAYMPPGIHFDVEVANAESKAEVGYERFGFWKFLIEDDAADLLREHVGGSEVLHVLGN